MLRSGVTALAETAEFWDKIEVARAEAARDRALGRLTRHTGADLVRAEAALARALNRLRVAERVDAVEPSLK